MFKLISDNNDALFFVQILILLRHLLVKIILVIVFYIKNLLTYIYIYIIICFQFSPDLVLVAAGFDGVEGDTLVRHFK
jgi:hypothetical protein